MSELQCANETAARLASASAARKRMALAIALAAMLAGAGLLLWQSGVVQFFSNKDQLVDWLRAPGAKGALLCIAAQFIQVVIFAIPGEIVQFAAGYVFGIWEGFAFSVVGITLGSAFNFYFAQLAGRPTLARLVGKGTLNKVDRLLNSAGGKSAIFLLFLIPGTPKDAMCYGAGLTNMGLFQFLLISGLARSPALIASIALGAHASEHNYQAMVLTGTGLAVAVVSYYVYERRRKAKQAVSLLR
jgi:uncharacterized membrane protein YdjX (TVP38/TMEM64 family)